MNSALRSSCAYILPKKKRTCRLDAVKGKSYCVEHLLSTDVDNIDSKTENTRIKCPLDPSHTCDKSRLEKHLKRCNAKKIIPGEAWYIKDVNCDNAEEHTNAVAFLRDVSVAELKILIEKLQSITISLPVLHSKQCPHPALVNDINDCANSTSAHRHLVQNSNLLVAMEDSQLIGSPACYIEFGAGRGQLTTSVIKAMQHSGLHSSSYVLVDRGANRRKFDTKLRQNGDFNMQRLRTDIKDLSLSHLDLLQSAPALPIVAISKHLCGVATDFTLKCLMRTCPESRLRGGIVALCCHHRCEWDQYCGKNYFKSVSLSARDFSIITLLSSWAVCHFLPGRSMSGAKNEFRFINNEEKVNVGIMCKKIIDLGRVEYLKQNGYAARLIEYTNRDMSLENIALIFKSEAKM